MIITIFINKNNYNFRQCLCVIRKSFNDIARARQWRDEQIRQRGVVEPSKISTNKIQSYSDLSDKTMVFADSDNIRDRFDAIDFGDWEEFK